MGLQMKRLQLGECEGLDDGQHELDRVLHQARCARGIDVKPCTEACRLGVHRRQLGLHDKPILLLDVGGWSGPLVALIDSFIGQGFIGKSSRQLFEVVHDVPAAMAVLAASASTDVSAERL